MVVGRAGWQPKALCLVQCRTRNVGEEDTGTWLHREVTLWVGDAPEFSYSFVERPGSGAFCGAVHSRYRREQGAGWIEEGPATVVFPDPWLFAVGTGEGNPAQPGSQFSYFLPVHP